MPNILTLDVSLAATGWAVVSLHGSTPETIQDCGCIRTKPDHRERVKGADTVHRVRSIARQLRDIIGQYQPIAIVAELPYGSQHAASAVAQGICYGIIGALAETHGIPLVMVTPQQSKQQVAGCRNASKSAIQECVFRWWPEASRGDGDEHVADALAALVAARDSEIYRMACNL